MKKWKVDYYFDDLSGSVIYLDNIRSCVSSFSELEDKVSSREMSYVEQLYKVS